MRVYREILKQYWGYSEFRPLQEEIVLSASQGRDTLALMPTGGGKSVTFQVPALAKEGICLVITPLIALMNDQVENLRARKIKAMAIHSGMTGHEIGIALDNCIYGDYKFLYLSPERLKTELFRIRVQKMKVNLIAVDEAHCISQWGYDFRPAYLEIPELRKLLPGVPVLALTATATSRVAKDIMQNLSFGKEHVLKKSFERKNLVYAVRKTEDKFRELLKIAGKVEGSAIIYVRNRKKTREVAELLQREGHKATFYHAGLKYDDRLGRQREWQSGKIRIMVSTNAFGMGIDKPDVRFVLHVDLPDSPEAYFQEAGRAGRDGKRAWAILLYGDSDERMVDRRIEINFPPFSVIREIYHALFNYLQVPVGAGKGMSYDFVLGDFLSAFKFNALTVASSLGILAREGYLVITEEINNPSRIHFTVGRDELYRFQLSNPEFDTFLKVMLRSYTGLFSQYVAFDEATLARRTNTTRDKVYQYLLKLAGLQIVSYIPKRKNPVITLLEERLEAKNIHLSAERYKFRKERYTERINELLEYARNDNKCRSQYLLTYFGELNAQRCGQCDVCVAGNALPEDHPDPREIRTQLLQLLSESPTDLETLTGKLGSDHLVVQLLNELQEQGRVVRRKDLRFAIR